MAQLRRDAVKFAQRDVVVVISGPGMREFAARARERCRFIGLPDSLHAVADAYGQEVNGWDACPP